MTLSAQNLSSVFSASLTQELSLLAELPPAESPPPTPHLPAENQQLLSSEPLARYRNLGAGDVDTASSSFVSGLDTWPYFSAIALSGLWWHWDKDCSLGEPMDCVELQRSALHHQPCHFFEKFASSGWPITMHIICFYTLFWGEETSNS